MLTCFISLHEIMDWPIAQSVIEMVNNQRILVAGVRNFSKCQELSFVFDDFLVRSLKSGSIDLLSREN